MVVVATCVVAVVVEVIVVVAVVATGGVGIGVEKAIDDAVVAAGIDAEEPLLANPRVVEAPRA